MPDPGVSALEKTVKVRFCEAKEEDLCVKIGNEWKIGPFGFGSLTRGQFHLKSRIK